MNNMNTFCNGSSELLKINSQGAENIPFSIYDLKHLFEEATSNRSPSS